MERYMLMWLSSSKILCYSRWTRLILILVNEYINLLWGGICSDFHIKCLLTILKKKIFDHKFILSFHVQAKKCAIMLNHYQENSTRVDQNLAEAMDLVMPGNVGLGRHVPMARLDNILTLGFCQIN